MISVIPVGQREFAKSDVDCVAMDTDKLDVYMIGSEKAFGNPTVELVLQVICTDMGSCITDPTLGVDRKGITFASADAEVKIESAYKNALAYLVPDMIDDLVVKAKVNRGNHSYSVTIEFTDRLTSGRFQVINT